MLSNFASLHWIHYDPYSHNISVHNFHLWLFPNHTMNNFESDRWEKISFQILVWMTTTSQQWIACACSLACTISIHDFSQSHYIRNNGERDSTISQKSSWRVYLFLFWWLYAIYDLFLITPWIDLQRQLMWNSFKLLFI